MGGRIGWWFGIIGLLVWGVAAGAQSPSKAIANADQAKAKAAQFFRAVGWQATEPLTATFPLSPADPEIWQVTAGNLTAELDSISGQLRRIFKWPHSPRNMSEVAISEEIANQAARRFLEIAGISLAEAQFESSKPMSNAAFDPNAFILWKVRYRRSYQGFLFAKDSLTVMLDPKDAGLNGIIYNFTSPRPERVEVKLSEAQAVEAARKHLTEIEVKVGDFVWARLEIVQPNYFWPEKKNSFGKTMESKPPRSRLAWTVGFDAPWEVTTVMVDAASGKVLGGDLSGRRKETAPAPETPAPDTPANK